MSDTEHPKAERVQPAPGEGNFSIRPREGEFYMEGPFLVFTEAYHLRRGYCCNTGCRHCPYK